MALAFIAESAASAIIENLVNTCQSYLEAYPAAGGMQDELERLQYALPQVQAVLTAVEEGAPAMVQNKALDTWLWQLRDAVESAEDVLDELDYHETIRDRDDKVRGIISKYKRKFDSFVNRIFSDDTLKRLREAVRGLDRVVLGMERLLQLVTGLYGPSVKRQKLEEIKKDRETTCLPTESEVLGRDKERDLIVEWLIKPGDADVDVSAFTIVGMGGLGKTTLARLVYHDKRVREYFDPIMWVCVSQDFDAAVIIRKMLEDVTNESFGDKSLNALHRIVEQKLTSKRFLLILDDVWNDDKRTQWENLVAPLKIGQSGSKILLTTRMDLVAEMAEKVLKCKRELLNLTKLEETDSMSLFNKHAFFGVNHNDYKNLQPVGERIAKKLGGCPLAIKVMGGILNSCMDYEYWKKILEEDIMRLQQGNDGIMTILRLSYDHLPTNLQLCFRYCSLFPQDYHFERKKLVNMWIGSGLIPQSICGSWRPPEDIGREYFDLLIKKSFFTCNTRNYGFKIYKHYFMHDLLHDLARSVSQGECIRIEGEKIEGITIPQTVRHLSAKMVDLLSIRKISNLKNVRTLVMRATNDHTHNADHALEFIEVIKGFKKLRLLTLDVNIHSYKLPDALISLIHLRYLSLSLSSVANESIKYDGLTNLVNLHSLDVPAIVNIPYISKLPFIHKLANFIVREESGYKIGELKNLKDLRHLCIKKLENVRTSEEAFEAKLNEKEYLKLLSLQWSANRSNSAEGDEELLNNLCPHVNLKKLHIGGYQGAKSPCWMTDLSLINLTSIELNNCKGWEHLPPLGQFSLLQCLRLRGLHAIKQIDCSFFESSNRCAFPSLKELWLDDFPNLEEWIGIDDGCMFPQLHTMKIIGCPNLTEIPTLPCSLRCLQISDVGLTALPTIKLDYADNNQQEHICALEDLTIENCEKLEYLPTEYFGKFSAIKYLKIVNCPKLRNRGSSDIQLPSALNGLTIRSCGDLEVPLLQLLPNLTSLTALTLNNCKELSSLGGIQALVSLRWLEIRGCDKLVEAALLLQPPFPNDAGQKNVEDCFLKPPRAPAHGAVEKSLLHPPVGSP